MYHDTQQYHTTSIENNIFSLFTEKLNTNNGNVRDSRELATQRAAHSHSQILLQEHQHTSMSTLPLSSAGNWKDTLVNKGLSREPFISGIVAALIGF